jgi:type II secretory pathway pseudopilin PulG
MYRPTQPRVPRLVVALGAFTLAEALLAATILAIVSSTAILPFLAGNQQVNEAAKLEQAAALGQALMEEILARPFSDPDGSPYTPGPEAGETSRNLFDNIDDFNGYSEAVGGIRNFKNAAVTAPSTNGFWRQASVTYVTFPALNQQTSDVNSLARIAVQVYYGNTLLLKLDRITTREN